MKIFVKILKCLFYMILVHINRHLRSELDRFTQSFEAMNTVFTFSTDTIEDERIFTPFTGKI